MLQTPDAIVGIPGIGNRSRPDRAGNWNSEGSGRRKGCLKGQKGMAYICNEIQLEGRRVRAEEVNRQ